MKLSLLLVVHFVIMRYRGLETNPYVRINGTTVCTWRKDTDSKRGWQVSIFVLEIVEKSEVLYYQT